MGEHTEITAKQWSISRDAQDRSRWTVTNVRLRLGSAASSNDLVIPAGESRRDSIPRKDTSLEKLSRLPLAFDRNQRPRHAQPRNSSPLTDGAAAVWVGSRQGMDRLPSRFLG